MTRCYAFVLALLLCVLDAAAAERRVLFAINDDGERVTIEPIVLLDPIAEPRMDDAAFARRYFASSRSYVASFNGKMTGDVRPVERVQTGCVSMAASALLTGAKEAQFATNFEPKPAGPTPREANDDEQYARFSEREPDPVQGVQWLFGTIDLDGDGVAELVTQRREKEGHAYVVLGRKNGRWVATEGGGAGC